MAIKQNQKVAKKNLSVFYDISLQVEKETNIFYDEYNILSKTVDSVNSFNALYKAGRTGVRGGPSTHDQQDLYRAMLIFACAGLDVFVKQLVKNKIPQLITADKEAENKFKEYVKRGLKKDDKVILNTIALALIDSSPRDIFLNEYINSMTGESLQSVGELCKVSEASGLDTKKIFSEVKKSMIRDAFEARNQIIHEMDINVGKSTSRTTGYRTRRQRVATNMEKHTKSILNLAEELFIAYKEKFQKYKIGVEKEKPIITKGS
ncbi:MAG: HEPN domain-containing protein [Candidatus Buchananbacteria bacterium]